MHTTHTLCLKACLENLHEIRCFIEQSGAELGIVLAALSELTLVVDEAVTNIVLHSDGGKGNGLEITMASLDGAVEIVIRDKAGPFNPDTVARPMLTTPLEDRPYGGMGLHLIKKLTDKVEFNYIPHQGNELRLLKYGVIS